MRASARELLVPFLTPLVWRDRGPNPRSTAPKADALTTRLSLWFQRRVLNIFFENIPFMSPRQPIKLSDLDKSRMKHGGLLNKHFCKRKFQISPMTQHTLSISTFPIISLWKLCCHNNQSSYPTGIPIQTHR